jgi:hypothetical protein
MEMEKEVSRHTLYLRKISELFGRDIKPREFPMMGRCISKYTDEVLDKAIEVTKTASTTNQVLYFLSICSSLDDNEDVKAKPKMI